MQSEGESRRGEAQGGGVGVGFWRRWSVISFGLARFENRGSRCQPVEVPTIQRIPRLPIN